MENKRENMIIEDTQNEVGLLAPEWQKHPKLLSDAVPIELEIDEVLFEQEIGRASCRERV